MSKEFDIALKLVWLTFMAYWLWSARWVKSSAQTEPFIKRFLAYWLPLIVAVLLLGPGEWFGHTLLRENFLPHTTLVESIGLAICVCGLAIAIWARYVLGQNWSATVQLKQDHELVERGPYRWVRHPIYSGLLLMFIGNAIMVGDWRGILAIAIVFVSFWGKLSLEEKWLNIGG